MARISWPLGLSPLLLRYSPIAPATQLSSTSLMEALSALPTALTSASGIGWHQATRLARPGLPLTAAETVEFKRLEGLSLVLPRRPSHWRAVLDETARSKGFSLNAALEADSLRMQKEIVVANTHLYALLGPFSISEELRAGRLQAARVVGPELRRYVTLAHARQGHFTQAGRIVSGLIKETASAWNDQLFLPEG